MARRKKKTKEQKPASSTFSLLDRTLIIQTKDFYNSFLQKLEKINQKIISKVDFLLHQQGPFKVTRPEIFMSRPIELCYHILPLPELHPIFDQKLQQILLILLNKLYQHSSKPPELLLSAVQGVFEYLQKKIQPFEGQFSICKRILQTSFDSVICRDEFVLKLLKQANINLPFNSKLVPTMRFGQIASIGQKMQIHVIEDSLDIQSQPLLDPLRQFQQIAESDLKTYKFKQAKLKNPLWESSSEQKFDRFKDKTIEDILNIIQGPNSQKSGRRSKKRKKNQQDQEVSIFRQKLESGQIQKCRLKPMLSDRWISELRREMEFLLK